LKLSDIFSASFQQSFLYWGYLKKKGDVEIEKAEHILFGNKKRMKKGIYGKMKMDYFRENYLSEEYRKEKKKMKKKMKVNYNKLAALALGLGLSTVMVACGRTANAAQNKTVTNNTQAISQKSAEKSTGSETKITVENGEIKTNGNGVSVEGKTITISAAGNYRLSGNLEDGQVVIAAGDTHKVNLILDNFSISNKETAPIYVKTSGDFTLTLAENSKNSVEDLREANTTEDSNSNSSNNKTEDIPDAAIYSKSDLILSGSGSLDVKGNYEDGIHGKDSLTIEGGNYTVEATKHGINGKDNLTINDGSFTITAGQDGFNTNGDMTVSKGSYTLSVSDDGMHADGKLVVNEGTVNIENSNEGLEGASIDINGGTITVKSQDDGLNAASDSNSGNEFAAQEGVYININGGTLRVNAGGNGLDSNGDLNISGGTLIVDGAGHGNGPLDYNGTGTITGGTVLVAGSNEMFQTFDGNSSTQAFMVDYLSNNQNAGTGIKINDSNGEEIFNVSDLQNSYGVVLFSSPELSNNQSYKLSMGDTTEEFTVSAIANTIGNGNAMGGGMGHGGPQGAAPNGGFNGGQNGGQNGGGPQGGPPNGGFQGGMNGNQGMPGDRGGFSGGDGNNFPGNPPDDNGMGMPPMNNGQGMERGGMNGNQGMPGDRGQGSMNNGQGMERGSRTDGQESKKNKQKSSKNNSSKKNTQAGNKQATQGTESNQAG